MTLKQIASLGKELAKFLALFACCFRSRPGFALCKIYVQGLLSSLQRKNVEAIALEFGKRPRTLQRFVESIKWDEACLRDQCQRSRNYHAQRFPGQHHSPESHRPRGEGDDQPVGACQ